MHYCKTAVIADKNGGKNAGSVQRVEQHQTPKTIYDISLPSLIIIIIPKETLQFFVQFVPVVGFFEIYIFFFFSDVSQCATELPTFQLTTLSSFSNTEHRKQKWFMHMKHEYFVLSKQDENISFRSSRHLWVQSKRCTHDKNRKRADLWVKNNLLMYLYVCIRFDT